MISPWAVAMATAIQLIGIRLLLPMRAYLFVTWPILLFGLATSLAYIFRGLDLVDLLLQLPTFTKQEIFSSLRPYSVEMALCIVATGALLFACFVTANPERRARPRAVYVLLALTVFVALTPKNVISRAWPSDFLFASASLADRSNRLRFNVFQDQAVGKSPRNSQSKWLVRDRPQYHGARQTLILIIGESVRSDYLRNCNGPDLIRPIHEGSLVACDVTAGADSTYHSVPLLISRELPGHTLRVSEDATFQNALSAVGFESYWLSVQSQLLAWSDARHQLYLDDVNDDELLPHLAYALNADYARKTIVVHANNAHYPYCARYDHAHAPYRVDCTRVRPDPALEDLDEQKLAYGNAVDNSIRFINEVIDEANHSAGEVFVVFTPDHAENFADDARDLMGHELVHPTRWDIQVPAIFWANEAWKRTHVDQWNNLRAQVSRPLTHADIVPTLMAATDVTYDDPRGAQAVNLLDFTVPDRSRLVQTSLGSKTDWKALLEEAK